MDDAIYNGMMYEFHLQRAKSQGFRPLTVKDFMRVVRSL